MDDVDAVSMGYGAGEIVWEWVGVCVCGKLRFGSFGRLVIDDDYKMGNLKACRIATRRRDTPTYPRTHILKHSPIEEFPLPASWVVSDDVGSCQTYRR